MSITRFWALLALASCSLFAQHEADPDAGQLLFRNQCVNCHGPAGRSLGGIDLLRGTFKQAKTDADLSKVIRTGVPGTAMVAMSLTETQVADLIAFLRASAKLPAQPAVKLGDAGRGKAIFEGKGGCTTCHRVRGSGSRFGPDLTDIATLRQPPQIERSILDPDAEVLPINRVYRVTPRAGAPVNGRILNQDTFTIQLIDAQQHLLSFDKATLRDVAVLEKSPMPAAKGKLTADEVADLVGYLASLKGN